MRLDYESLRYPETDILKYHEYNLSQTNYRTIYVFFTLLPLDNIAIVAIPVISFMATLTKQQAI